MDAPGRDAVGVPLTERLLGRLGRPRWLWIALWAALALASPIVFSAAIAAVARPLDAAELTELATTQVGLAFATLVLLGGVGVITSRAEAVRADLDRLLGHPGARGYFGRLDDIAGPVLLTALVAGITSAAGWVRFGPLPPLVALPFLLGYLLPIMTFVWVYLVVLLEIDRLGRQPLRLDTFPEDRSLGLERVGELASTGLGMLLLAVAPVLVVGSDQLHTFLISMAVVAVAAAAFVLSMWRLHGQMSDAKARSVAVAQRLYAEAYGPMRAGPTLEMLDRQAASLRAAQALDERARSLLTWPVSEGALRFVAVVVTSVVASVIVRALFAAVGA